ncbi:MAG: hypothetical protein KGD64_13940 [Candidatus Heimdallarchaeota archaeon]|nr:hypothetical protein [Candidatus Heimdallarchaeota archaeon]
MHYDERKKEKVGLVPYYLFSVAYSCKPMFYCTFEQMTFKRSSSMTDERSSNEGTVTDSNLIY